MSQISIETQKLHIKNYADEMHTYELYADVLQKVLQEVVKLQAPEALVQTRAKSLDSFSEKIIRKDKYTDPLTEMTDLCGARVISHFTKQVDAVIEMIAENFEIDRQNSRDARTDLSLSEFGYLSIHYIVTPRKDEILGIKIPDTIKGKKAEIQIRTFHQHIWADIVHDRLYKSSINVSDHWKRESARLAATLEETDNTFEKMSDTIDQLSINYLPTPRPEKTEREIEILASLVELYPEVNKKSAELRVKLSRILNAIDRWKETLDLLLPLIGHDNITHLPVYGDVLRAYGYANVCYGNTLGDTELKDTGYSFLEKAVSIYQQTPRRDSRLALTYFYLAGSEDKNAISYLQEAHKDAPNNPFYYTALLIEKLHVNPEQIKDNLDLHWADLEKVLHICKNHIELGIEVPQAYMTIGKICLLQGNYMDCMDAYLSLMRIVVREENIYSRSMLLRELKQLEKLESVNSFHSNIILGLLHLMLWQKYKLLESKKFLSAFKHETLHKTDKALIICGRSGKTDADTLEEYKKYCQEALLDFAGVVVSGGTSTGIPGLVGSVKSDLEEEKQNQMRLLGYLPLNKKASKYYDSLVQTNSEEFSALEVVSYWSDILLSNIEPQQVTILGIHGGFISSVEYRFGLIMGARVLLVGKLGGSAQQIAMDQAWSNMPNLFDLPTDPFTIWAMLSQDRKARLTNEEINKLAPIVHEFYRIKRRKGLKPDTETDINKYRVIMKWDLLSQSLKLANLKQVAFMEHLLNRGGFQIRKSNKPRNYVIDENCDSLNTMAELEHARWNAERLLDGWKFGPKNTMEKTTPYLIPWDELDDEIKTYDYDPVKNFPGLLKKIGYELVRVN